MGFEALGFRFSFCADDGGLERRALELLAPFTTSAERPVCHYAIRDERAAGATRYALYANDERATGASTEYEVLAYLFWHLNRQVVQASSDLLLVHAGAVQLGSVGLVVSAVAEAGKSTLVAALVRDGFGYLTDEIAAVDTTTLQVVPYPKPLSLAPGSYELFAELPPLPSEATADPNGQIQVAPDDLRHGAVGSPCVPGLVVIPQYEPNGVTAATPVSRAEMVAFLAGNSFNFKLHGAAGLRLLADLVMGARCFRLTIRDAGEAVEAVHRLLDASGGESHHG